MRRSLALLSLALLAGGCGTVHRVGGSSSAAARRHRLQQLLAGARPIGRGPRFQPGPGISPPGACRRPFGGRRHAHVEIFGADRVVLLATGIGTRPPRRIRDGRLLAAGCFGEVATVDPTGTVYFRAGTRPTVADLFRTWGQPLTATRIASFTGGRVRVYVDGHRRSGPPGAVALMPDAEIVLEIGPRVPPHSHFTFGPAPSAQLP
jgi:hypothetical protein